MSVSETTWLGRLRDEHNALKDRVKKLDSFLDTPSFAQLPLIEQSDLERQNSLMHRYLNILSRRMARAEPSILTWRG